MADLIDKIINGVWSGKYSSRKLPAEYYQEFSNQLEKNIKKGFGVKKITNKTRYADAIGEFSENAQMFSAAKTYHMTRELEQAKKDAKSKKEYKEQATKIIEKYDRWGEVENQTMLAQAQSAKKWKMIEEDAELFPKLRYSTIGDACDICRPLNNIVAPVDSPFWKRYAPTNHFGCLCIVEQELSSARNTPKSKLDRLSYDLTQIMDDTFISNPGQTNEAFPRHAYFDVPKGDRAFAKRNFDLPIEPIR